MFNEIQTDIDVPTSIDTETTQGSQLGVADATNAYTEGSHMAIQMSTGREIHLTQNPDGLWTARDEEVEISAQGETRAGALENLDAVVAAVTGDGRREPTDEELRELGIDPEENTSGGDLPDVLQ